MTIGTPTAVVMDGRDALLAVGMNGEPLPAEHGFPVRMVVPGLYGYVSATKWLTDLELTRFDKATPYWTERGWAKKAPIKTMSRIDTPRPFGKLKPGKVAVAGVAWAQHRGIDKVEVRVDGGAWQTARLADVPSIDTWRQWVWQWDATPGSHTLEVRATDRSGVTQPEKRGTPVPLRRDRMALDRSDGRLIPAPPHVPAPARVRRHTQPDRSSTCMSVPPVRSPSRLPA